LTILTKYNFSRHG